MFLGLSRICSWDGFAKYYMEILIGVVIKAQFLKRLSIALMGMCAFGYLVLRWFMKACLLSTRKTPNKPSKEIAA